MKDTATKATPTSPIEPNIHLYQFLNDNNYELSVGALTNTNPFIDGKGFVLTEKPLLVVSVRRKESHV